MPCLACRESLKGFDALYHICFKGFCDCWSFWGVQYIYSFVLYCIDTVSTAESVNLSTEFTIKCPGNRPHYSMCSKSIPYHGNRTNLYINLYLGHQRVLYAIRSTWTSSRNHTMSQCANILSRVVVVVRIQGYLTSQTSHSKLEQACIFISPPLSSPVK